MQESTSLAPPVTPWQSLMISLGTPSCTPEQIAAEADARVALRWSAGRPGKLYTSALEAGIDHRMWLLERDRADAASIFAAAIDDVDGAFGPREAVDLAKVRLDDLARREYLAMAYAAIARRIALAWEMREAESELAALEVDPPRLQYDDSPRFVESGPRAFQSANDEPRGVDVITKSELRDFERARVSRQSATSYSVAFNVVVGIRSRIDRWSDDHPALARQYAATSS